MEIKEPEENYSSGFIKIYRSVVNHWLWIEKPFSKFEAWIYLLIRANYKSAKVNIGFELFDVERGSFICSQEKLAQQFGWSRNQVRSFLNLLEADKMLISETNSKFTKITISNYDTYQSNLPADLQPSNNQLTTTLQPTDNEQALIKKEKKEKNVKKDKKMSAPEINEVVDFFKQNGYAEEIAKKAFEYYSTANWTDSKGNAVRNWKQKMIAVWFKPENKNGNTDKNGHIKIKTQEELIAAGGFGKL